MVEYFNSLWASCRDAYKNPVLLVPFLAQAAVSVVIGVFFVIIAFLAVGGPAVFESFTTMGPAGFSAFNWLPLIPIVIIGIFVMVLVGAWFGAGILGMTGNVAQGQPAAGFFKNARELFSKLFLYQILTGLLFLVLALPMLLFVFLAIFNTGELVANILLAIFFGLIFFALALVLGVALFFAQAIITRKRAGAWEAITASFRLMKQRPGHVWASWGVTLLFAMVISMFMGGVTMPINLAAKISPTPALGVLVVLATLFRVFVQIAISIILMIYMFRMYDAIPTLKKQ